jgi:hypothetical protein
MKIVWKRQDKMLELFVGVIVGIVIGTHFDCSGLTELLMRYIRPLLKPRDKGDCEPKGSAK